MKKFKVVTLGLAMVAAMCLVGCSKKEAAPKAEAKPAAEKKPAAKKAPAKKAPAKK